MEQDPKQHVEYSDIRSGQIVLTVKSARDLPAVDAGGTSDPYVITRLETPQGKSDKMKTKGKLYINYSPLPFEFSPLN